MKRLENNLEQLWRKIKSENFQIARINIKS